MRERKLFRFNSSEDSTMWYTNRELLRSKISELRSKLSEDGTFYDGWNFWIYSDSKDLDLIWIEAEKLGLKPEIGTFKMEYTKKDYNQAKYFMLSISIFGKADYTESYETKYVEVSKCERCGKPILKQDSELYIDKALFRGKDIGITSNREIVVSEGLKGFIENAELTGIEFANVKHKNTRIKNDFNVYQMLIKDTLNEMDKSTTVYCDPMGYCNLCKTHGQVLTSLPKYRDSVVEFIKDFNLTQEYFGGGDSDYQSIIITKKVYDLLSKNKIKGCKYDIVLTV